MVGVGCCQAHYVGEGECKAGGNSRGKGLKAGRKESRRGKRKQYLCKKNLYPGEEAKEEEKASENVTKQTLGSTYL